VLLGVSIYARNNVSPTAKRKTSHRNNEGFISCDDAGRRRIESRSYVFVLEHSFTQNEPSEWGFTDLLLKKKPLTSHAF
jgi:hypothetical protein